MVADYLVTVCDQTVDESSRVRKSRCKVSFVTGCGYDSRVVLLQAMKQDVPLDIKCKDKFLLQTTSIKDASADANLTDLVSPHPKYAADMQVGGNRKVCL
jgi:hypothetical protein